LALSTHLGTEAISNSGFHGLTQVVYEYTSSAANNGSGFEGLADNTPFTTTGLIIYPPLLQCKKFRNWAEY